MVDNVNHPAHYTSGAAKCACGRSIECIQVTEHMNFCMGNATKYLWRADLKGGVEDLKKAVWYIQREIARREGMPKVGAVRACDASGRPLGWHLSDDSFAT